MVLLQDLDTSIEEKQTENLYNGTRTFFEFPTQYAPANFIHNAFENSQEIEDYTLKKIDPNYYIVIVTVCPKTDTGPCTIQLEMWEDGFMVYRSSSVFSSAIETVLNKIKQQTQKI